MNRDRSRAPTRATALGGVLLAGVLVAVVVLAMGGGVVLAQEDGSGGTERGEPDVSVYLPDNEVDPGEEATLEFEIANDATVDQGRGSAEITTARATTVEIRDGGPFDVRTGETHVGSVPDGESVPATARIEVPDDLEAGSYDVDVRVRYSVTNRVTSDSVQRLSRSTTETVSVRVTEQPRFEISGLGGDLSVGHDGEVEGTLTNRGNETVTDGVLVVEPSTDSLHVADTRYALPTLERNASTGFRYPVDVGGSADAGPRQLRFHVEYTDGPSIQSGEDAGGSGEQAAGGSSTGGDVTRYGPISQRVEVAPRTDEFAVDDDGIEIEAGTEAEFHLVITNQRSQTLSDVDARMYDDGPLTATNDRAFVPALEPGESAELKFAVAVDAGASAEYHPVELDFQYDTERGDSVLSDTYRHPIEVTPASDDGGGVPVGTIVFVLTLLSLLGAGAALWWRRA